MEEKLIVFDFDGTLTARDSMLEFTRFYVGNPRFAAGMLLLMPVLLLYKAGLIPNWRAKEYYLSHFFGQVPLAKFQAMCDQFGAEKIPSLIRPAARAQLDAYLKEGIPIVVVSSSAENWLRHWCAENGLRLIGTRLRQENGTVTGQLDGPNCYGPEKVRRLKEVFDLSKFQEIIVYGDSKGDHALFEIASRHFYKPFSV